MPGAYADEIHERLTNDMVHFPEAFWVVREHEPGATDDAVLAKMIDAVVDLAGSGRAVVGDLGRAENGLLTVVPWPERGEPLRERLRAEMAGLPLPPRLGEGFWIERRPL